LLQQETGPGSCRSGTRRQGSIGRNKARSHLCEIQCGANVGGTAVSTLPAQRAAPVTLDQLAALNDEIRALVRVGVPLEHGLALMGKEMPGPTGRLAQWVAECLRRGQTLEQVMAEYPERFPPIYRAVVQAGERSGRLSAALESVASAVRRLAQTRRMVAASLLYPLLVLLLAWGFFVFYTVRLAHGFLFLVNDMGISGDFFATLDRWGQSAHVWGPILPLVVLLLLGLWWMGSGRASLADPGTAGILLGWLPGMRRMLRNYQVATFSELMAMLLEHQVPLHEAVLLAAQATGGSRLKEASLQIAVALQRGEPLGPTFEAAGCLPPLLVWLMSSGQQRDALVPALRQAADIYQQRAHHQAEAARVFVPVFLTMFLGGGVTLAYALVVLGSWFSVMRALA